MQRDLTQGSVLKSMAAFSLPYLLSTYLQTLYGLADLFIAGQYGGADIISAVSIGSQVMHMLTVVIVGLAMGSTVVISRSVGARDARLMARAAGNTITLFLGVAAALTAALLLTVDGVVSVMSTPPEAARQTRQYLMICFAGLPCIVLYNIISAVLRGMGDSRSPMAFVAVACTLNILLDYVFIGGLGMAASGAALGTVISQTCSVVFALLYLRHKRRQQRFDLPMTAADLRPDRRVMGQLLRIGLPVACQDAFIQISFLLITVIANRRGVDAAAAVGIVEKLISLLFLVPSALMSTVSALAAQCVGASLHDRARRVLRYALTICTGFGLCCAALFQLIPEQALSLFADESEVIRQGAAYLRSYVWDCVFAGIHFCFSGFFCAYGLSSLSFAHNVASMVLVRVPGAYAASMLYPETLYPMGWASPLGSLLSAVICLGAYGWLKKKQRRDKKAFYI